MQNFFLQDRCERNTFHFSKDIANETSQNRVFIISKALTEKREQEHGEQCEKTAAEGPGRAAVHLVLLANAHLNFDLRAVGQRRLS